MAKASVPTEPSQSRAEHPGIDALGVVREDVTHGGVSFPLAGGRTIVAMIWR
jgi:hypothetical protein